MTRLTIDLLGGVPLGHVDVCGSLVRPGRRFQVVDATLSPAAGVPHASRGRCACAGRSLPGRRPRRAAGCRGRLRRRSAGTPLRAVRRAASASTSIRTRARSATSRASSAAAPWQRGSACAASCSPGEPPSQLARVAAAADFANGLSWILPIDRWLFVNTELTIHLAREPRGEWIGLDARTTSSAAGFGLATATLHDLDGPIGVCAQSLFVEPR